MNNSDSPGKNRVAGCSSCSVRVSGSRHHQPEEHPSRPGVVNVHLLSALCSHPPRPSYATPPSSMTLKPIKSPRSRIASACAP